MINKPDLNQWATVFRGFGNENRLKILKLLRASEKTSVSELSQELKISLKNTSRNLKILADLDLVEFKGRQDRVYYSLSHRLPDSIRRILKIIMK